MPERQRGTLNVILGANNLGKSTAAQTVASEEGFFYIKYPIYKLEPHGPIIDDVVHNKRPMEAAELQLHYAENRRDYEPYLNAILETGKSAIVEDYVFTGIVWGLVEGLSLYNLFEINERIKKPDRYILMDGNRFNTGREKGHRFEDEGDSKWQKARDLFMSFALAYNWEIVNANQTREKVKQDILDIILSS